MQDTSKGKIFLAGERGHTETDWFRSYNTFNFGEYQSEAKKPFGPLYVANDDTLAGGKTISLTTEVPTVVILLPVVGALSYEDSMGRKATLQAGQVQLLYTPPQTTIYISNPFEQELINYLQFWFKCPAPFHSLFQTDTFTITDQPNSLIPLFSLPQPAATATFLQGYIGKFNGREEAVYRLSKSGTSLFTFVIQGAFEVQYRLMEARDGLSVWGVDEIELEALSNEAIIVVIELDMEAYNE